MVPDGDEDIKGKFSRFLPDAWERGDPIVKRPCEPLVRLQRGGSALQLT
jgi:hypothetical protein